MAGHSSDPSWQRAIVILTGSVVGVIVVGCLYWVQDVLIPVALAIFLTFILAPFVRILQKHGLGRVLSVSLVMLLATSFLGGIGWIMGRQMTALVRELPDYEANIKRKMDSIKSIDAGGGRLEQMIDDLGKQWRERQPASASQPPNPTPLPAGGDEASHRVFVSSSNSWWMSVAPHYFGTALASLATLVFVLALGLFMLLKKEDLRARILRLAGREHLTLTTRAVDEACQRISRFLTSQFLLNSAYGVLLAVGLALMGVQHPLLWGIMMAVMRYIPYIGAWIVGALMVALSIATSADWLHPGLVLALFLVLEAVASNVAEPLIYGKSIGVSQVALLVAAAFWAFLWGPIGLVLSGPMTVCLVVLGKYVPQLKFLDVLLSDKPALAPDVSFYQRLLAHDREEAVALVMDEAKTKRAEQICDALLAPALMSAKRDHNRDELSEADETYVHQVIREILNDLHAKRQEDAGPDQAGNPHRRVHIMCCPGQDEADVLTLEMLRQVLEPAVWDVDIQSADKSTAEMIAVVREKQPSVVCIGALAPGGLSQAAYFCQRLRHALPNVQIVVGRWKLKGGIEQNRDELKAAGADEVATTFADMRDILQRRLAACAADDSPSQPIIPAALKERAPQLANSKVG